MHADPSSLDAKTLAACLRSSAGEERDRQVDFLRYLDPFDAHEAYREAGYGSLWQFCLRELLLREGAAGRRIGAMRALREFPALEAALRDGRLSLTTVVTLRTVLTKENLDEVVARAAFKTDEETRHLVATLSPRSAPKEGIRKLPDPAPRLLEPTPDPARPAARDELVAARAVDAKEAPTAPEPPQSVPPQDRPSFALTAPVRPPNRPALEPLSADQWSMRVTIDAALKGDLEKLKCLLSHKLPDGNVAEVLREAVRCAIEKHGKRRGAVKPKRERKPAERKGSPAGAREPIPAAVKRAVWERDGGRCAYVSAEGHRCESRWQLEYDHVEPASRGGPSTVENTRLRCKGHNLLHAEKAFGREHMARFRKRSGSRSAATIAGDSARSVNISGP
jgi:5-methylcytosine-specific restriction endonuclease McrA